MKTIKIAKVPGIVVEIAVPAEATLQDVLNIYAESYGESTSGYEVRIGDGTAAMTVVPADGTKVYLVKQVKGNR